ncbi:MAG: MFS transporter [Verrucomicrobia bacterium]|nr:MAG: MFS transporter [Verrucomicrobiota bacterium]
MLAGLCAALASWRAAGSVARVPASMSPRTLPMVVAGLFGVFFMLGMSPGYYIPALSNILVAKGLAAKWAGWAFLAGPVASLVSPLCLGALADNHYPAQKVFGWIGLISAVLLAGAFWTLDHGGSPWWFIGLLTASSIVAAPMWGMLASISMVHLKSGEREFPLVRLGGTLGWMAAGFMTSHVLHADQSAVAGYAAAATRFVGGLVSFFLPHTPPMGSARSLRSLLGLDAFRLLKERDHLVFFSVTVMLSIPLAAFFLHTPLYLQAMGNRTAAATMTIGQISEIGAMLLMPLVMNRFRVKTVLMVALVLSAVRYGFYAVSGICGSMNWLLWGIGLHGMCYTLYFITGQLFLDRRVEPGMRGQAQGLLSLASNGLGSLLGTLIASRLHQFTVLGGQGGWTTYWWVQAACIALTVPVLAFFYQGVAVAKRD